MDNLTKLQYIIKKLITKIPFAYSKTIMWFSDINGFYFLGLQIFNFLNSILVIVD
jgi:hypothetical protein